MAVIPSSCKFHVVSSTVDTVDRGSAEFQSQRKVFTMSDICETIGSSPYVSAGGALGIKPLCGTNDLGSNASCSVIAGGTNNTVPSPQTFVGMGCNVSLTVCSTNVGVVAASNSGVERCSLTVGNIFMGAVVNTCMQTDGDSAIVAGFNHCMDGSGRSFIGAGQVNKTTQDNTFIGTGFNNCVCASSSAIVSGTNSSISGSSSFIGTGNAHCITSSGQTSVIGGGTGNCIQARGSAILGGCSNVVPASCEHAMIIGNGITADRVCATFVNNLSIKNIPTASTGLPSGSVWSNSGVLNIVA
tara:strand:+ start:1450 stop:2349 length:900 start_codon:yes stop_codon:yes gene_type:complete